MNLKELLDVEEHLLNNKIVPSLNLDDSLTLNEANLKQLYRLVHTEVTNALVWKYVSSIIELNTDSFSDYFEGTHTNNTLFENVSINDSEIPSLCEQLHISYLNSCFVTKGNCIIRKKSKENLIEGGAVYTQEEIAYSIVKRTLDNLSCDINNANILDFATGTGRFYKEIVKYLDEKGISPNVSITKLIYAIDVDPLAINILRISALSLLDKPTKESLKVISQHVICRNALINDMFYSDNSLTPEDLNGLHYGKFDAIVSNPPYLVLKPNKRKMDEQTINNINNLAKFFRTSKSYQYAIEGMLNLYQLSLEAMIAMLKEGGQMGIICPSTLFADISASKLRKYFLKAHNVYYIKYFSEDDPLFDNVTQATCIFNLQKGTPTTKIEIENHCKEFNILLEDVKCVFDKNWEIPSVEEIEWKILKKLKAYPKLKNNIDIRNKRGELDLTLYKEYITTEKTDYRLVRGNMISENELKDINHEYVMPSFIEEKSEDYKKNDLGKKRLICQQISNQAQSKRLHFVYSEANDILGNSCNYISSTENNLNRLYILLNSSLLNWRFKVTSTNNHINNYELDELPIINLNLITSEVLKLSGLEQERKICSLYGLEEEEICFLTNKHYEII